MPLANSKQETLTFREALQRASTLLQNQQLSKAEKLYEDILAAVPDHFGALHLLGTIKVRQGKSEQGAALIRAALRSNPNSPYALNSLGVALRNLHRRDEA